MNDMPVSEQDLELLDAHLDGELPAVEAAALRERLQNDVELATALEALRADRSTREMVWQSFEPSEESVDRLVARVQRKIDSHWAWSERLVKLRPLTAAAACLLIGVLIGRAQSIHQGVTPYRVENGQAAPAMLTRTDQPQQMGANGQPTFVAANNNDNGQLRPVPAGQGGVAVPLVDNTGRVIAVQHFDSPEKATKFINDLRQSQNAQEQIHNGASNIVPVGDERF
jgi:hypothetical protein